MHRIQKYQVGGGINVDWAKMLNLPSTSLYDTIQKSGNFLASTLANSGSKVVPDISKMAGLLKPGGLKDLGNVIGGGFNSLLGQGGSNVLKGLKGFTGMNPGQITGIAGDLAGMGLGALGVRKMDSKGANAFDKGLNFAAKAVGVIPGIGPILSGGFQLAKVFNDHAGGTSNELGTEDMSLTGYNLATSSMADTKFGFSDTVKGWFGTSGKDLANRTTRTANKLNLSAGNIGYQESQNKLAANNSLYHIGSWNKQQLDGGVGTRLVAAQKGTKLPKLFKNGGIAQKNNLKSIVLKAQKGAKIKEPILGKENFEDYRKRIGKLNPSFLKDDPYYNLRGAFEGGLEPELNEEDGMYHLGSRNPKTGEILKRPGHPTWDLMLKGEEEAGYEVYQEGDKWFSREKKKYKDGGLLTKTDKKEVIEEVAEEKVNVIPEGAFHSRKNNLPTEISEQVTPKGIPVVSEEGGGTLKQHAEIEKNEIIFHKEATETMEELLEKYDNAKDQKEKDAIAIKCGKYITKEILVNTDDRTGLIDSIK